MVSLFELANLAVSKLDSSLFDISTVKEVPGKFFHYCCDETNDVVSYVGINKI